MSDLRIHPTAVVDPRARVESGVEIGPYSIIGPDVVIGSETTIASHVLIEGNVTVGERNSIGHGAVIGTPPQDLAYKSATKSGTTIGNQNVIREYCTIHRGTAEGTVTQIGNNNFLMVGAHVGHNCQIGNEVIIANNCLLGGYVRIDDGAFLGGACVFHQFMHVGRLVITQGESAFSKDIPPFVMAAERNRVFGLNVVGLRRAGLSAKEREEIKMAFRLIYTSSLNISQALQKTAGTSLTGPAREFIDFVASAKKRGICPYKSGADEL